MATVVVEYQDEAFNTDQGVIVNSHWSDAFGCWILLITTDSGKLVSVRSDTLGLRAKWVEESPNIVLIGGDEDDDDGYIRDEEG